MTDGMPIVSSASISWLMRMVPSSATMPQPTLAPIAKPKNSGVISRVSHREVKMPTSDWAPPSWASE